MKPTLLILAAGMGSRYGGLKQVDQLGPSGETILEYSIYDNQLIKHIQKHYIEIYNANHSKETIAKAYLDTLSLYL